jgi:UDP-glucuronate 4-epimerase
MKILVTGVAGFIGFHLASYLINSKKNIVGLDNLNNYYDMELKKARLSNLKKMGMKFSKIDISKKKILEEFLSKNQFDVIVHLAAQAGVRHSIDNPQSYLDSNIVGFFNLLEGCRQTNIKHLIYASSSSVYGGNVSVPFDEEQNVDSPQNFYAATKKTNELMSYSYSQLFKIPCTGLRFFTVYGPWGRPDMAYFKFVKNIFEGKPIEIYNNGKMFRDFTYIDDIIDGIVKLLNKGPPKISIEKHNSRLLNQHIPWEIFNIGNNKVVPLDKFVEVIENVVGKKAIKKYLGMQNGDMLTTSANIEKIKSYTGFNPRTSIEKGLPHFINWYKDFYKIN